MLIVVGGMIGLGKSSVAEILGEHFKSDVFYESVDDNPILLCFIVKVKKKSKRRDIHFYYNFIS